MIQVNHQIFDLTLANKQARHIFIAVLLVHVLISLLAAWGLPDFSMKKRPDLIIELGASMPASSATTNSSATQSPSPKTEKNIEPEKKLGSELLLSNPARVLHPQYPARHPWVMPQWWMLITKLRT